MGCNYLLRAGADQYNITDLSLSSHPSTHCNYDTSGRREWLIKEAIAAKDHKIIMRNNWNTTTGMGIVRNAGKVEESDEEHGAGEAGDRADGDTDLSGWRCRSQNCNGNNYDCNGVVIKIMES